MDINTHLRIKKMSPQLLVADIGASIEFYTQKIGFELDFRYEDFYAGIIKDGYSIHLKLGSPSLEERQHKLEHDDLDIVFSIEDVETLYNDFVNKGIQITQPLCERPYGKEFYIADPDGYILAFLEETT
ncbi:VOC family protein [Pedobacter sp.]|uniref:VOC family protein n=1 Tax=Pedobacter sp. TaxID=1411316 RepID=UPI0031D98545